MGEGELGGLPGETPYPADLTGDLPCVRCRYNLRGLSVLGDCPECATPISTTVLARVDPHASELRPIALPKLTGVGIVVWSVSGLLCALVTWWLRLAPPLGVGRSFQPELAKLATGLILLSGVASLAHVRPHDEIPPRRILGATVGVLLYLPLAWIYWRISGVLDPSMPPGVLPGSVLSEQRTVLSLLSSAIIALIVLLQRPNARDLAVRSLVMRRGAVDRQTLVALAAAVSVMILGNLVHLCAGLVPFDVGEIVRTVGTIVIGVGAILTTIGLLNVVIDTLRLFPVVTQPPLAIEDVVGKRDP